MNITQGKIDELNERTLAALPSGRAKFDPITLIIISTIIGTVLTHYLQKMMGKCEARSVRRPGIWARWQLRRKIREVASSDVVWQLTQDYPETQWKFAARNDADRLLGDEIHAALLQMAGNLGDDELRAAGVRV